MAVPDTRWMWPRPHSLPLSHPQVTSPVAVPPENAIRDTSQDQCPHRPPPPCPGISWEEIATIISWKLIPGPRRCRDIKPHNILVDSDGTFLIADFGVAIETGTHISGRVRTGKGGTLQCMAPEICEDRPYSAKCDVWSLGCTIYEMLTLGPAFPANTGRIDTDLREVNPPPEIRHFFVGASSSRIDTDVWEIVSSARNHHTAFLVRLSTLACALCVG